MGLGDILDDGMRIASSLAPANLAASALLQATGNGDNPAANPRVDAPTSLTGAATPTKLPGALYVAFGHLPVVEQVFQTLDAPRRAIDTALISAQHYASTDPARKGVDWAEFFNSNTWSRAWDMASMDNPDRVTGGQIVAGRAFGGDQAVGFDPLNEAEAARLQEEANGTWYGRTMSAMTDLGESFVSLPGAGTVARLSRAHGSVTVGEWNAAAERFNEAGVVGRTGPQKVKDAALHLSVPSGAQNVDARVASVAKGLAALDGDLDRWSVYNKLKTRMEDAPEGEVAKIANQMVEINKIADPAKRERLRTNLYLSGMGSTVAKEAFVTEAPLLAKSFENQTTTPREAAVFTELFETRLKPGADLPINDIVEKVWNTKSDIAERDLLKDHVRQLKTSKRDYDQKIRDLQALKPRVRDTPESRHIAAKRDDMRAEARKLEDELKAARQDLHGAKRWAAGAAKKADGVGATDDVVDFNQAIGDARRRVEDVQSRLEAARSDRDLLDSTPMHDPETLDNWRSMVDQQRLERAGIGSELDAVKARRKELADQIAVKESEIRGVAPLLDEANSRVSEILDIAGPDSNMALTGNAQPTLLNRLKDHMRQQIGAEHVVTVGKGNTVVRLLSLPDDKARRALAPAARGSISLNEIGLGVRQLEDTMLRSKVFSAEDIAAARNELIRNDGASRFAVVARVQDQMFKRIAIEWFQKKLPELTPEEAVARAEELTSLTRKHWGQGNDWVTKASNEQLDSDMVFIRDIDGQWVGYNGPTLRSQLADSAPILDPWDIRRDLDNEGNVFALNVRNGVHLAANSHDFLVKVWKTGAIMRPGLFVRSQLDTGMRTMASLTAAQSAISAMNGTANFVRNRSLKGVAKVKFSGLSTPEAMAKLRFQGTTPFSAGGQNWQLAEDNLDLQAKMSAAAKGDTIHQAINHDMTRQYDKLTVDRASWEWHEPDAALWHVAYKEYATQLLNSPAGKMVADLYTKVDDGVDIAALREQIKESPVFTREYRIYAQKVMTKSEWLDRLLHEVTLMFPNEKLLKAARDGGLTQKLIDREIPRTARFTVPGPETSALKAKSQFAGGKKIMDGLWRLLLDKPDMWLNRNPVMVQTYKARVRQEIAMLEHLNGKGYKVSQREKELIHAKAQNAAIGYVRRTFFDTSRYNAMHRSLARISPFFAAWEDAMISWGRLIYDDPRRLTKLSAAYHAPYTLSASQNYDLVFDQSGEPISRGSDADGAFVELPAPAARFIAKRLGQDPHGMGAYMVRADSVNTIAQGETFWLPGVGPTVSAPLTWALGSGKVVSREAALELSDTENPIGRAILKSVFLGGEVPPSDVKSIATSTTPGWVRTAFTQYFGEGKIRTQTYAFNQLVMEAQANGEVLDTKKWAEITDRSERMANAAATVRLAMTAGLGFSGSATVDAQFYVDQMNIIHAMPPEMRVDDKGNQLSPTEFFAYKYPEAADYDWSVTKNKTGISATVHAAKSESRLGPLLKSNPEDLGWMVLGKDNVVPEEFSRTAYSMQKSDGKRVYQDPSEALSDAQASVGYKQLNAWSQQVADQLVAAGFDENTVTWSKEYRAAKSALRDYLAQTNPAFARKSTQFNVQFDYFYGQAKRLSSGGPLKDRSDMVTFRDYDAARAEIMRHFGIKSFNGKDPKYGQAKAAMREVGGILAQRDLGFQQMWDRFLEKEVD